MNDFLLYILGSIFFLTLSFCSYKLVRLKPESTFWIMIYLLFNAFVAAQQYSICFDKSYTYNYPISLEITDGLRLVSVTFLILHVLIMIKPLRKQVKS
jgi:hypothetical protein